MKIYQKTKFHQSENVVVCVMTARVKIMGLNFSASTVRGIARCAPEDQFDLKKGQMIAESKATQKMYNRIGSNMNKVLKATVQDLDEIKGELAKLASMKDIEERHFEEICH
jgi:hypothetical protein|nr:MAG TPA: hypothetical protein [Crassvirales sp.]